MVALTIRPRTFSCAAVANGSIAAVFQATVAPEYQGRVFTLMASVATAMTPVGLLLATPIADLTGVRTWYLAGGMACTILGAATFLVRPILEMEECPRLKGVGSEAGSASEGPVEMAPHRPPSHHLSVHVSERVSCRETQGGVEP